MKTVQAMMYGRMRMPAVNAPAPPMNWKMRGT
jgi:hypothetical protein